MSTSQRRDVLQKHALRHHFFDQPQELANQFGARVLQPKPLAGNAERLTRWPAGQQVESVYPGLR